MVLDGPSSVTFLQFMAICEVVPHRTSKSLSASFVMGKIVFICTIFDINDSAYATVLTSFVTFVGTDPEWKSTHPGAD